MNDEIGEAKRSAASELVDLAEEMFSFGVTPEGEPYARPLPDGHVVRQLRGGRRSLRAELAAAYRRRTGKVAAQQALAEAVLALEGIAQEAEPVAAHLRVAQHEDEIYIDLGDAGEHVVKIAHGRWDIIETGVPVLFRRTALTGEFPIPERGGDIHELWELLNVEAVDRPVVLAWLVAALACPGIPHPALALFGEQGTGKSTAARTLVALTDPSPVPLRKPPREADGWVTAAAGSWVVALDNLSTVPDWLSDSLCRAVTGDGDVRRRLYSDQDLAVFSFRRCLLLNGIDLGGLRGDLAERLAVVNLEVIGETERRSEADLTTRWEAAYPRILGALLDSVAGMAGVLPSVRLTGKPRMADFALVLAALDEMNSTDGLARFLDRAETLATDSLTSEPFVVALMAQVTSSFEGTASELLAEVNEAQGEKFRAPRGWPTSARMVTGLLKRNAPALRKTGWIVENLGTANKRCTTIWRLDAPSTREEGGKIPAIPAIPASCPPPAQTLPKQAGNAPGAFPAYPGHPGLIPATPASVSAGQDTLAGKAGIAGFESGQSQDDNPPGVHSIACTVCGSPMDPTLADAGETSHPNCGGAW